MGSSRSFSTSCLKSQSNHYSSEDEISAHKDREATRCALSSLKRRCLSAIVEQRVCLDPKTTSNPGNIVDRDISLGSLNAAEVSAIHAALVCQGLLTKTARSPKPAHVSRQHVPKRSLVRPFHKGISGGCRF